MEEYHELDIDSCRPVLDPSTTERWPIIYNQKRVTQTLLDLEKLDLQGKYLESPIAMNQVLDCLSSRHKSIIDEATELDRLIGIKEDVLIGFLDLLCQRNIDDVDRNPHPEQGRQGAPLNSRISEFYSGLREVYPKKSRVTQREGESASLSVPPESESTSRTYINPATNIRVQSHEIEYDGKLLNMKVTIRSGLRFPVYNIGATLITSDLNKSARSILVAELNPDCEAILYLSTELECKNMNAVVPLIIWWCSKKNDYGSQLPSFNYIESTLHSQQPDVHKMQLIDVFHIHLNEKLMAFDTQSTIGFVSSDNIGGCGISISVYPKTTALPQRCCLHNIFPNLRGFKGEKYFQFGGAVCANSSIKVRGIYYELPNRQDYELIFTERSESNIFLRKLSWLMPEGVIIRPNLVPRKIMGLMEESIMGLQAELKLILELIYCPTQEDLPTTNLEPPLLSSDRIVCRFVIQQLHTDFCIGRLVNEILPLCAR